MSDQPNPRVADRSQRSVAAALLSFAVMLHRDDTLSVAGGNSGIGEAIVRAAA